MYGLLEDKSGRIWAFTELGAQRHNGQRFETVPGLPARHSVIYTSENEPDGGIFMYSSSGKSGVFKEEKWQMHPLSNQIEQLSHRKNDPVYHAKFGRKGSLFLQSGFNLLQMKPKESRLQVLDMNGVEPGLSIYVLENEGELLVCSPIVGLGTDPEIVPNKTYTIHFIEGSGDRISTQIEPETRHYRRFFAVRYAEVTALSAFDVLVFKTKNNPLKTRKLPSEIMNLKWGPDRRFWVATRHHGIYFFDTELNLVDSTLAGKAVGDVVFDKQGGVWASTLNEGIFYLPNLWMRIYNPVFPSPDNNLHLNAFKNELVIGVNKSLIRNRDGLDKRVNLPIATDFAQTDLLPIADGYLLASKQGILRLDSNFALTGRILSDKSKDDVYGNSFCQHKGRVYFTSRTGLFQVSGATAETRIIRQSLCYGAKSFAGFLWLATSEGLCIYSTDNQSVTLVKELLKGREIVKIKVDESGLWAVVPGQGIFRIDRHFKIEKVLGFEKFSGLRDFVLTADSQLFVAGGSGLLKGRLKADFSFAPEQLIYSQTVNQVVSFKDQIWFSGRSGVLFFPLSKGLRIPYSPLLLRNVGINNEQRNPHFPAVFEPGENNLTFRFDLLSFSTPQSGLIFQLTCEQSQLGKTDGKELGFQNLSPGRYHLMVEGQGMFGEKLSQPVQFSFEIKPAFWQTWWFRVTVFILVVLFISVIIWLIFNYFRKRDEERNRINQLLASYKLRALQSQMNPHFVSNALAAIQQLVLTKEHLKANQYLTKFSRLLRLVLSFSEKPFIPLSGEINLINLNVELERLRFANRFSFSLEMAENVNADELLIPSMITQPFVENAIWHGLIPLKEGLEAVLKMTISLENERLIIVIEDNGIGRKASAVKKDLNHNSIGLRLTMERLQNINQLMESTLASVEVEDLVESDQPSGTRIRLTLPSTIHQNYAESLLD